MDSRIGTCSLCGGDVMAWTGAWWSVNPPPSARCVKCNAVQSKDIIQMTRSVNYPPNPFESLNECSRKS